MLTWRSWLLIFSLYIAELQSNHTEQFLMNMQRLSCSLEAKRWWYRPSAKVFVCNLFFGNGAGDDEKRIDDNARENIVPGPAAGWIRWRRVGEMWTQQICWHWTPDTSWRVWMFWAQIDSKRQTQVICWSRFSDFTRVFEWGKKKKQPERSLVSLPSLPCPLLSLLSTSRVELSGVSLEIKASSLVLL